jgi:hypothetical protein
MVAPAGERGHSFAIAKTLGSSFDPPEPARVLSQHFLRAAGAFSPIPVWLERYALTAMSPSARQLVWAVGRRMTGNPDHGFAIAARVPVEGIGSLWPLYRCAPNLATVQRTLRLHMTFAGRSYLMQLLNQFSRAAWHCRTGDTIALSDTTIRIVATRDGYPAEVDFTFTAPLERYRFMQWRAGKYGRFAWPSLDQRGQRVRL